MRVHRKATDPRLQVSKSYYVESLRPEVGPSKSCPLIEYISAIFFKHIKVSLRHIKSDRTLYNAFPLRNIRPGVCLKNRSPSPEDFSKPRSSAGAEAQASRSLRNGDYRSCCDQSVTSSRFFCLVNLRIWNNPLKMPRLSMVGATGIEPVTPPV